MALTGLNSPRDFFRVWFFWKRHAIAMFFAIIVFVIVALIVAQPQYEAKAKIAILPRTTGGLVISTGAEVERIDRVEREDINTEIELLNSEDVIRNTVEYFTAQGKDIGIKKGEKSWYKGVLAKIKGAINRLLIAIKLKEPMSDVDAMVLQLNEALTVEPIAMSNVIEVKLRSEEREQAAPLLNSLLDTYVKQHNEVFSKEAGINFFQDQANEYQIKLAETERELKDLQSQWHIIDLEAQYKDKIDQLSDLKKDLREVEVLIDETEAKLDILREGLAKELEITKEMRNIPAIVELEKALVKLFVERSEVLKNFTTSSREYRSVDGQIRSIRGQIKDEVRKAIKTEELELYSLRAKHTSLNDKISKTLVEANELVERERFLNESKRKISLFQDNYLLYAAKTEDARINSERKKRDLANVSIAERANTPANAAYPKANLLLAVALIVAFFAAIGTPFILEFLDRRIKTAHEVEKLLSLPVICTLPEIKKTARK